MKTLENNFLPALKTTLLLIAIIFGTMVTAQVAINTDGSNPNASAILDINSDTAGILIPRMTKLQRDAISTPAAGLMIYQTDDVTGFYYYNGTDWNVIGSEAFSIDDLSDGKTSFTNIFLGNAAGANDDKLFNKNVALGDSAMNSNITGSRNTALGYRTLRYNIAGACNIAIGNCALLNNNSNNNTGVGFKSLYSNTSGESNTATGYGSLISNSTGNNNVAYGSFALSDLNSGSYNVAIGSSTDRYNKSGSNNTIIGFYAGRGSYNISKSGNVFLGYKAGYSETGDNKLYIENSDDTMPLIYGEFDNNILTVHGKLGIGTKSPAVQLQVINGSDASLTDGGYFITGLTTSQNIVIDENEIMARNNGDISAIHLQRDGGAFNLHYSNPESKQFVVASSGKTGIGENSPDSKLHINTVSGENGLRVRIEGNTKLKVASNGSVVVGYNATSPTFALQLQNSAVDSLGRAIAYSWTTYSDGRLKTEQKELTYGLNVVMQLQPKSYNHHSSETLEDGTFTMTGSQTTHTFGFIAQELNQIIPEAVYVPKDESKNLWAIDYEKLIPVLTKAIQEQQSQIEAQQKALTEQKEIIETLIRKVEELK